MIICGNCGEKHAGVSGVKRCYGRSESDVLVLDSEGEMLAIDISEKVRVPFTPDEVLPGRYAIRDMTNRVLFYKVDHGKGKWDGYVFLEQMYGAPGDFAYQSVRDRTERETVLRQIFDDGLDNSMALFGQELGICADCGSPLTDEVSRAFGRGPVCRNK